MPDNSAISGSRVSKADTYDIFSPQGETRPGNRYLTEVTEDDGEYCVMHCTLPPGVVVPLHSHSDRETFYVISGNPESYQRDHWETLGPGDVADVQEGIRHAWRNSAGAPVTMICVTTMRMARFLRDIAVGKGSGDQASTARRFLELVEEHGYWLASPEENAAIGLDTNWGR